MVRGGFLHPLVMLELSTDTLAQFLGGRATPPGCPEICIKFNIELTQCNNFRNPNQNEAHCSHSFPTSVMEDFGNHIE